MARTDGQFKKGTAPGKPKGAVNHTTKQARELFIDTLEGEAEHIKAAFASIRVKDPARYLEIFAKYAQYFVPRKVNIESDDKQVINITIKKKPTQENNKK